MENLVEVVTKELDFQLQTPFLLYRSALQLWAIGCRRVPSHHAVGMTADLKTIKI